jgi:acetylglutamate kinase
VSRVVVKLGGHALDVTSDAHELLRTLASDIRDMQSAGDAVVLIHGGGPQINALVESRGLTTSFVNGLRVTTPEVLECVVMGLSMVNARIVGQLVRHGLSAVGVHGASGGLITCSFRDEALGHVGTQPRINESMITHMLDLGWLPVIAPYAIDDSGSLVNCNADAVAGAVAGALNADTLLLLSDVDQVRRVPSDPDSGIDTMTRDDAQSLLTDGNAHGGMRPKIESALTSLDNGAHRVLIANGSRPHCVRDVTRGLAMSTEVVA